MQKKPANKALGPVTQGRLYDDEEMALLEQLARDGYSRGEIVELFPDRTVCAIKSKITKLRHQMGVAFERKAGERPDAALDPDDPGFEDGWWFAHKRSMAFCNSQFVAALHRYAA